MVKKFIFLEWKSFIRAASLKTSLFLKIVMALLALYFAACFAIVSGALFFILEEKKLPPLETVNKYLIFYLFADIIVRFFMQKTPVMNVKPFLYLNIKKKSIIHYVLGKTFLSYFNWTHLFILIPFSGVMMYKGFSVIGTLTWLFSIYALLLINNFLVILMDKNDRFFYSMATIMALLCASQYYHLFEISVYTAPVFSSFFHQNLLIILVLMLLIIVYRFTFQFFKKNLNLDEITSKDQKSVQNIDIKWFKNTGYFGIILENDIRMILRNKRSKTTVMMSFLFLFYGLLFYSGGVDAYNNPAMRIFGGIFVTGGFLFTFGQFVPSWDSAYYPLLMSQNIPYRAYLEAKWWLIVAATIFSTLLASFYLYFGWQTYLLILAAAVYNIGINSYLVLWGGAFVKTPIDLTSSQKAFGDKKAFNIQTLLISFPKLVLPMLLYWLGSYFFNENAGVLFVMLAGVLGFAFRNKMFAVILKIYKKEKYKTLAAYRQK